MAEYFVSASLNELKKKAELLKYLKVSSAKEDNFYEYEKLLAAYYLIEICSGLEHSLKTLIEQLIDSGSASEGLKEYAKSTKFIPNAEFGSLCKFLGNVEGRSKELLKKRVKPEEIDALTSLYTNRQKIVHHSESKTVNITYKEVIDWHRLSIRVVKKFETILKKII